MKLSARSKSFWVAGLVLVFLGILTAVLINQRDAVIQFLRWIQQIGFWGPVLFILLYTAFIIFLLPTVVLTFAAGFLFGIFHGSAYVVLSITLGAAVAFLIARYLFGERVTRYILQHPKLRVLDYELVREGWKIILLSRLVPFFPAKAANYFFGLARFRLKDFLIGTLLGVIPLTIINVYIGSLISDLTAIGSGQTLRSPLQWAAYGLGFAIAIVAFIYITRIARRAMTKAMNQGPQ